VSFWSRIRSRFEKKPEPTPIAPPPTTEPPPPSRKETEQAERSLLLEPLRALARGDSVTLDQARSALTRATGTADERAALDAVSAAHRRGVAPDALCTQAARLAVDRGDSKLALELLGKLASTDALMMAADLHESVGDAALALTLVERVLARELDLPGARERHQRLREKLGTSGPEAEIIGAGATVLRAGAPETSLRILGEAGRGGAGTVYEAVDDVLGRRVALKVYHRPEEDRDKLENEARTAVTLGGRGVVRIFDADTERGLIVMEWLPGSALKRWLEEPKELLPLDRWLVPLAETLARIHALGFVHGDLKPANVMFRTFDEPILSDFGLARRATELLLGGSRGYMSPERLGGTSLGLGEDVYAFGRILEDVLVALGPDADPRYHGLVPRLLEPGPDRPADAGQLVPLLREPSS
jgi:eukaryotic-like serine/threonine-protein kinase